jgi:hypothetical protein
MKPIADKSFLENYDRESISQHKPI